MRAGQISRRIACSLLASALAGLWACATIPDACVSVCEDPETEACTRCVDDERARAAEDRRKRREERARQTLPPSTFPSGGGGGGGGGMPGGY